MNHPDYLRRRLSQCLEADEEEDDDSTATGPTSSASSDAGGTSRQPSRPSSSASGSTTSSIRRHVSPKWVDTSLPPLRAPAPALISTLEPGDIWLQRASQVKDPSLGVVPGAGENMSSDPYRSRYGQLNSYTWGSHTAALREHERRQKASRGDVVYHTVTGAVSQTSHKQHQVPSIFEIFRPRSKSDAASKKPIVGSAKNSTKSQSSTSGDSGEHSRGPVAKVIHLFRNRSQSAASAEEKRKARAAALHQQQVAAHSAVRKSSIEKRRLSLGTTGTIPGGHRGSDPSLDPNHAAILFRDSRGLPVADPFLEKVSMSDLEEDESQIFVKFFKFHRCYGLIPTSAKLVVFDTQLLVKKAFFALVYNGVRAAPLWDSKLHKFVGMLTITDFIKILQKMHSSDDIPLDQMEEHKLDTWRTMLKDESINLISIGPDASLYDAIRTLIHNHIHRLPVIDPDTGNVLYILTHKRILRFLFLYMNDLPRPSFLNKSLSELRIGTFDNIATATQETSIIDCLDKFVDRRVSALPVVDDQKRLVDIFAKFDVINLAAEKTYDKLDMSIKEANEHRNEWFEGVHKCSMDDTLFAIIEKIVRAEVHRLVVTDDEDKVIGILSLSDLLQYLVLRPCGEDVCSRPVTPIAELSGACASEETILEGEEDEDDEQAETREPEAEEGERATEEQESSLSREPSPPLLQPPWRGEVTVSGGE